MDHDDKLAIMEVGFRLPGSLGNRLISGREAPTH